MLSRVLLSHGIQLPFQRPTPPSLPIQHGETMGAKFYPGWHPMHTDQRWLPHTTADASLHMQHLSLWVCSNPAAQP